MKFHAIAAGCMLMLASGCANMTPVIGDASSKTVATGAAGGASAHNANAQLERCDKALGTLAIVEEGNQPWLGQLVSRYKMQSTVPMLRLIVQQSNCFVVVERGKAFENMQRERELMQSGELRQASAIGKGMMVAADYTVMPSVSFSERGTGGGSGGLGGWAGVAMLVAGTVKRNEASTMLVMTDNRSGVQLAAAEGSAKNWDWGVLGAVFDGGLAGGGAYSKTPEGKLLIAAFMDSYNQLVRAVRNYQAQSVEGGLGTGGKLKTQ